MPDTSITLFGPPRLTRDGKPITLNHRKAWALLAYLAVTGQPHSRDALATLLWPDYGQSEARTHLRRELLRLRKLLGTDFFLADREQIALHPSTAEQAPGMVDVVRFQTLMDQINQCVRTHNVQHMDSSGHLVTPESAGTDSTFACEHCFPLFTAAADCYTDHFLAGFTLPDSADFDDWQYFERDALSHTFATVLERLVHTYAARPNATNADIEQAIPYAQRWLTHDPLHEPAHRALMTLYAQTGQQTAALRQFDTCTRILREELDAPPEEETTALAEAIRTRRLERVKVRQDAVVISPSEHAPSPPHAHPVTPSPQHLVTPPPPHTLPTHATPFVGREEELGYYRARLEKNNLATISGMAGAGKSSLALSLALEFAPREQIFWHTFQADESVDAVLWRLAAFLAGHGQDALWQLLQSTQQLGTQPLPQSAINDYLAHLLRSGQAHRGTYLLCFDDLHHVEGDAAAEEPLRRLTELVRAGDVAVIVTSRRIPSFAQFAPTQPLVGMTLDDTIELLAEHNLSLPDEAIFQLHAETEGNAQFLTLAIHALRRATDPLATISRLAAAEDLERHLLLLVNTLLTTEEWAVMAAVSVLQGYPGTRDAIEAIAEDARVRDALLSLAERYLLTVSSSDYGRVYHAHSIVQKFFYNGLQRRERQAMHQRAADYYAQDEPDPIQATSHYLYAGEAAKAAQLITSQTRRLLRRGRVRALRRLLTRFHVDQLDEREGIAVCLAKGQVRAVLGDYAEARSHFQTGLDLAAKLAGMHAPAQEARPISGEPFELARHDKQINSRSVVRPVETVVGLQALRAQLCLGMAGAVEHEDPKGALAWAEQGVAWLAGADPLLDADLQIKIGGIQAALGNFNAAVTHLTQARTRLPARPNYLHMVICENLGVAHFYLGAMDDALCPMGARASACASPRSAAARGGPAQQFGGLQDGGRCVG